MTTAITPDSLSERAAITLLRMTGGLILHQCLYVAATLGIADLLNDGGATAAELAGTLHVDEEALHRVLRLLTGYGVFEEIACRTFANSQISECLRTDVAGSVRPLLIMRGGPDTLAALGELLFSVTTGKSSFEKLRGSEMFAHLRRSRGQALMFGDAMTALTALWASRIAAAYDFAPWGSLMDVGGGNGLLLAEILNAHRGLRGVLAEQPEVLERARQRGFFSGELAERVQFESCDFFRAIPAGCRAYLLKMIIHDWNDHAAVRILQNCHHAMPASGTLLVIERRLEPDYRNALLVLLLDLQMLVNLGGRERTDDEYRSLFAAAGFELSAIAPLHDVAGFAVFEGTPDRSFSP